MFGYATVLLQNASLQIKNNKDKESALTGRTSLSSFSNLPPSTSDTARCSRRYFYRSNDRNEHVSLRLYSVKLEKVITMQITLNIQTSEVPVCLAF